MKNRLAHYRLVPYAKSDQLLDDNCVPVHNENINQSYIHRDRCMTRYFHVDDWYRLRNRSECICHADRQFVPCVNDNNDNSLPVVLVNHIIDYWRSVPLNNDRYFPDDDINPFVDFIPVDTPNQSIDDDDEDNNDAINHDWTSAEDDSEDDINLNINDDPVSAYSPDNSLPTFSLNEDGILDNDYDYSFLVNLDGDEPVEPSIIFDDGQ